MAIAARAFTGVAIIWGLSACEAPTPSDSVGWRKESLSSWTDSSHYVKLSYPVVVGAAAARLNPVLVRFRAISDS
jgi:hypothetical protein